MLLGELLSVFSLFLREFRMVCRLPTGCGICFPMARSVHGIRLRLDFSCSSSLSVRDAEIENLWLPLYNERDETMGNSDGSQRQKRPWSSIGFRPT